MCVHDHGIGDWETVIGEEVEEREEIEKKGTRRIGGVGGRWEVGGG